MIAAISCPVVGFPVPDLSSAMAAIASGSERTCNVSVSIYRSSTEINTATGLPFLVIVTRSQVPCTALTSSLSPFFASANDVVSMATT